MFAVGAGLTKWDGRRIVLRRDSGAQTMMKNFKVLTVLAVGMLIPGLMALVVSLLAFPELREPSDLLFAFGVGAASGPAVVGPILVPLAFRAKLRWWLAFHGRAFERVALIAMAAALACLFASLRSHTSDVLTGLSLLVLY